ncbi:trypsin domain-containing protein [Phthorimaea operculella]|nr:trypsin domain-containing protein [Phthorimaea operculella]
MSIRGPPVIKYDPCNLGLIYFEQVTEKIWKSYVFLNKYSADLKNEVDMQVDFERNVTVLGIAVKSPVTAKSFQFKIKGTIPARYQFLVQLDENDTSNVPYVTKFSLNDHVLCDETIKASQTIESLNVTKDEEVYAHVCGRRAIDHAELNSVRTEAQPGDFPWHVAILFKIPNTNDTRYVCGGNIISRTSIVTAGHCVREFGMTLGPDRIVIVAGVSNHKDVTQPGRQVLMAEQVILHPNYDDKEATADLAVIKVNRLTFTKYVQPICIWGPVYDKTNLFGHQATVVGFGTTEDDKLSDDLRSMNTMVQNDTTCINSDPGLYTPLLNEFTFCAGFGPEFDMNPRNGDSGGGLIVPVVQHDYKLSWFLRGVLSKCGVSQGQTMCDPRFYMVYTDVGPHYGWIYHHSGLQYSSNIVRRKKIYNKSTRNTGLYSP